MKVKPLPAEQMKEEGQMIDILKFVHQSQKAESLQHRQNLFNVFTRWTAALLVIFSAIIALKNDLATYKMAIGAVVSVLSVLVIWFMCRQRSFAAEGLRIARDIEARLGLFEEGRYWPCQSVLPEHFADPKERPTVSDLIQIAIIVVLTVPVWVVLFT